MLKVDSLSVKYGSLTIVDNISIDVGCGQWLMVVGPNGAGKSTLLGAVSQGIDYTGTVSFHDTDIQGIKPVELAKKMGVLMQSHTVGYSFTVGEIVRLGRYAYSRGLLASMSSEDESMVHSALDQTGMLPMENQSVLTLSGGELQRTFLAQLLAQNPQILLLDEPSNHLDLKYQKKVFELVGDWLAKDESRAVVSVVHDLSLAKAYGSHAMLMNGGRAISQGGIDEVLTGENLDRAYDMDVHGWMRSMLGQWE